MTNSEGDTFIIHYKTIVDDLSSDRQTIEISQPEKASAQNTEQQQQQQQQTDQAIFTKLEEKLFNHYQSVNEAEKKMINDFISGEQCLNGGQGWWKYEICLGKHVMQYHEDEQTKKRNNVLLGTWDMKKHQDWIEKHPNKQPSSNKNDRM